MVRSAVCFWFVPPFRAAFRDLSGSGRTFRRMGCFLSPLPVRKAAVCMQIRFFRSFCLRRAGGVAWRSLLFPIRLRRKSWPIRLQPPPPAGCNVEARERFRSRTCSGHRGEAGFVCGRGFLPSFRYRRVLAAGPPAGQWSRRNAASRSSSCANCSGRFICEMQTRMPCCRLPVELSEMAQTP